MACLKTLGYPISNIIGYAYFLEANLPWNDAISNDVIPHVYMLWGVVKNHISWQRDGPLVGTIDNWSQVGVFLSKSARQPSVEGDYEFNFNGWGCHALLKFRLPRDCSIPKLKALSDCRFSAIHIVGKVWVGVVHYVWVLPRTEEDAKVLCAYQVSMLDCIPMWSA